MTRLFFQPLGNVRPLHRVAKGFTLTELAMVLAILSLLFVFLMPTSTALLNNQKRELTKQRLKNIETALVNYIAVNKRLPCPALGSISSGTANAGTEGARRTTTLSTRRAGDCDNDQATGVVPWIAIGLSEADVLDGWDHRISYRVGFSLTRDNALDMTNCDPAGTAAADTASAAEYASPGGRCQSTCISTDMSTCTSPGNYLAGKGLDINDGAGTTLIMSKAAFTGAAFVLISHGENGEGAYNSDGLNLTAPTAKISGDREAFNKNGPAATVTDALPSQVSTFRDAPLSDGEAASYFDDILLRPSVFSVIQRAQLGPRSR